MYQNYTCQFEDHNGEAIIGFCMNLDCNLPPQCCVQCLKKKHSDHSDDCQGFQNITIFLQKLIKEKKELQNGFVNLMKKVKEQIDTKIKDFQNDHDKLFELEQLLKEQKYFELKKNIHIIKANYIIEQKLKEKTQEQQTILFNYFDKLCQGQEKILTQFDQQISQLYYQKGIKLINAEKWEDSIMYLDQFLIKDQMNCDAISSKGRALWKLKKYNEANQCIEIGLKINPNHSNLNLEKGNVLGELNNHTEALVFLDKSISLNTKNHSAYNSKGISLKNLQQYDEAIKCYDRAIQLDPNFAYAFNNKGNSLYNLKLYDEAIKCYDRAIQLDPNFSKAYNNKGISLKNLQQYDEAIKCYDRAIQLDPNCAMAYQNKGIVLENLQQYSKAIDCYKLALQNGGSRQVLESRIKKLQNK